MLMDYIPRAAALIALLGGLAVGGACEQAGRAEHTATEAGREATGPPLRTIAVSSLAELEEALSSAEPGDLIEVADGTYETTDRIRVKKSGTAERPIVVRARNRGGAVIAGRCGVVFDSAAYVVFEGFRLTHSSESRSCELKNCHDVRITRNRFRLTEDSTQSIEWVYITGESHHNRIDHNLFEEKHRIGNFISLHGVSKSDQPTGRASQYDRIDHNHFRNIGPRVRNGMEAIRLGNSKMSMSSAYCSVESNLFENCDGDPEFISVKCSDNSIRYNTCTNCEGSLVLRHGNRSVAEGNFFFCTDGKRGVGGIRVYGDDHKVINNYFEGLTGKGDEAPLVLCNGDTDTGPLDARFRPHRAVIAFNTLVNCVNSSIDIGFDDAGTMRLPSQDCTIASNIVVASSGKLVNVIHPAENLTWAGNIMLATGSATLGVSLPHDGIRVLDPRLRQSEGLWRLSDGSPAMDAAEGAYVDVVEDMDGHRRVGKRDVGADEYSTAPVLRRPLRPSDVGVDGAE